MIKMVPTGSWGVTRSTMHFSAANSMDLSLFHFSSICRSSCSRSQSAELSMTRCRRESSAKRLLRLRPPRMRKDVERKVRLMMGQ